MRSQSERERERGGGDAAARLRAVPNPVDGGVVHHEQ